MNIDLRGQTALITGASGQLGRVMARTLAKCGADIVIHYMNNELKAAELQAEIEGIGCRAVTVQADVTKADEVMAMKERALELTGAVDIVVANAVVQYKWTSVLDQPLEDYISQFESCVIQSVLLA